MTFANITDPISGGSGTLEYRLHIEGFDFEFCTSQLMANASTFPKRINGLNRMGLKFDQSLQLPEPILEMNSNSITIVDYQEQATIAFYRKPTFSTYLNSNVNPTDTTWHIANSDGLSIGDHLWIGCEVVKVLAMSPLDTNTIFVQRGALASTPCSHYTVTIMGQINRPFLENAPYTIERRRAKIYVYGRGDNLQGAGTLIWRGVVKTDPSFKGDNYTLQIGPITDVLKPSIGVDGDDIKLQGLNFGNFPWTITAELVIIEPSAKIIIGSIATTPEIDLTSDLAGIPKYFWATLDEFIISANQKIQLACAASFGDGPGGVNGGCKLTNDGELIFTSISTLDICYGIRYQTIQNPLHFNEPVAIDYFGKSLTNQWNLFIDGNVGAKTNGAYTEQGVQYCQTLDTRVPNFPQQLMIYNAPYTNAYAQEGNQFHLSAYGLTPLVDSILIYKDDLLVAKTNTYADMSLDLSTNVLTANLFIPASSPVVQQIIIADNNYKIMIGTSYRNYVDGSNRYNVVGFIRFLIENTPLYVNSGLVPLITEDDVDIEDMQRVFNTISLKSIQNGRVYAFYKKIDSLEAMLAEEFKLIGVYPALTREGKLTIQKLKNVNSIETPDFELDSGDILTDQSYINIDSNTFGIINSVAIFTGYNAITQKYEDRPIIHNNVDAQSRFKAKQQTIKPISEVQQTNQTFSQTAREDYVDIMLRATSMYSEKYGVATIEIPMKYFFINLGSIVRFKSKQLPNYTPNFAWLTSRKGGTFSGMVVGKKFDLSTGFGMITVLVSDIPFDAANASTKAVLAPDAIITNVVSQGANIYKVTLDAATSALYMDKTDTQEDHWFVGDGVRFDQMDSTSINKGSGKILAISGSANALVMTVDMNSPGSTPSGFTTAGRRFYMRPSDANSTLTSPRQLQYAFYSDGTVNINNTNYPGAQSKKTAY